MRAAGELTGLRYVAAFAPSGAFSVRTGATWPILIDGRAALRDDAWVIDLSAAPEMVLTVVHIR